ncbi:hypothetical protein AAG906_008891 [Vitis piasezkii]
MASITASTPTSSLPRVGLRPNGGTVGTSSAILGLPVMAKKGRVTCSMKEKPSVEDGSLKMGMGASLMAAACAATMSSPHRRDGLPFGLSNNTLGWILFGVFGLIWALYFVYTATLEEDEESGLSL